MKTVAQIKEIISDIHKKWLELGDSLDDYKYAQIYEEQVNVLLLTYCEAMKYEVEGYPFKQRELSLENEDFDDDYFYERNELYLNSLANVHDDVFNLLHFYYNLFWSDQITDESDTRESIQLIIKHSDVDFKY